MSFLVSIVPFHSILFEYNCKVCIAVSDDNKPERRDKVLPRSCDKIWLPQKAPIVSSILNWQARTEICCSKWCLCKKKIVRHNVLTHNLQIRMLKVKARGSQQSAPFMVVSDHLQDKLDPLSCYVIHNSVPRVCPSISAAMHLLHF